MTVNVEPYSYDNDSAAKRLLYKPVGGMRSGGCHVEVFFPSSPKPAGGFPVVMLFHGGAFTVGQTREQPPDQVNYLLASGVAIVDVEYRLAPHANIVEMNQDCLNAYDWVRTELDGLLSTDDAGPTINVDRVSLAGYSAGGYLAAMLGCVASPPPRALLAFYGLMDLVVCGTTPRENAFLGLHPREKSFVDLVWDGGCLASADHEREKPGPRRAWMTAVMVSDALLANLLPADMPNTDANRATLSPFHLATSAYPPTFLAIPQMDLLVAPSQSWSFAEKLKSLGVEVDSGRANMAPHAFDRKGGPENAPGGQWWKVSKAGLDFLIART